MAPDIIAEISFNRPQDKTEEDRRIVSLSASKGELYFSFELGKAEDDIVGLAFPLSEYLLKLGITLSEADK